MNSQEQESIQQEEEPTSNFDSEVVKYLTKLHINNTTQSPVSSNNTHRLSRKRSKTNTTVSPPLQRTLSEPMNYSNVPPTVEPVKNNDYVPKSVSKPPLPPLRRTSSAPIPSDYHLLFSSNVTPPRQTVDARAMVSSPVSDEEESASAKRLKRMKESMQVMTDWVQQVLIEDEQPVNDPVHETETAECDRDDEAEADKGAEECVWVDENPGGSLTIHFKCPCGKAYEVLLSGNNCYYKLM